MATPTFRPGQRWLPSLPCLRPGHDESPLVTSLVVSDTKTGVNLFWYRVPLFFDAPKQQANGSMTHCVLDVRHKGVEGDYASFAPWI